MEVILNIGCNVNGAYRWNSEAVESAIRSWLILNGDLKIAVVPSDTEVTVIASTQINGDLFDFQCINELSICLGQDAIAVYFPEAERGLLIGPKAAEWGEFNPAYFFLPNGQRLQPVALPVAVPDQYQGHCADGGGVQKHSAGGIYPCVIAVRETLGVRKFELLAYGEVIECPTWDIAYSTAEQLNAGRQASS